MKITIECKEVLHSLCPTDLHVPEKIILLCFLPQGVVRRVQKWDSTTKTLVLASHTHKHSFGSLRNLFYPTYVGKKPRVHADTHTRNSYRLKE